MTEGLFSSKSNEWATPAQTFNQLDEEFHFNLDPCSTHENAKCERHFTIKEDGLKQDWGGGQECSVILHLAGNYQSGYANATRKAKKVHSSSCLSRRARTLRGFGIISTTRQRSALFGDGFTSTNQSKALPSHL